VISYYFKSEIQSYLRNQQTQHFPADFWFLIQHSLNFLLSASSNEQFSDLVIVLQPFFEIDPLLVFLTNKKTDVHEFFHSFFSLTVQHIQDLFENSLDLRFFHRFLSEIIQRQPLFRFNYSTLLIKNTRQFFKSIDLNTKVKFLSLLSSVLNYYIDFNETETILCQFNIIDFISQFSHDFNQDDLPKTFESAFYFFIEYCKAFSIEWIPPKEISQSTTSLESIYNFSY
jgi:hypothetical protein